VIVFLIAFSVAVLLTPFLIYFSTKNGLFDLPGHRKVHARPIPRLGGVSIFAAVMSAWAYICFFKSSLIPVEAMGPIQAIFVGSFIMWFAGLIDDLKGLTPTQKLMIQFVAASIAVWGGVQIRILNNPFGFGDVFFESELLIYLISVFWIVFVTNSINLIDGLDGLAGGVCFITALSLYFISRDLGIPHLPMFSLAVAGSCLGFLFFNFQPARIFLGDSGALFLGFVLACLSILGTVKRSTAIVMFGPPLILALPVLDTVLAIIRRLVMGQAPASFKNPKLLIPRLKEVFRADQGHIHHGLLKIGLSHRRAVFILYSVATLLGISAYRVAVKSHMTLTFVMIGVLAAGLLWLMRKVKKTERKSGAR
jgi:UDP-GlcNAc:undecaprenyl-phosphate GlcNAc-1-phosphate transferase